MIVETESDLNVLRAFCNRPFEYFSIYELSKEARISISWAYKIIHKLEHYGIVEKFGKKFKLDFSSLFCKRLKLILDSEYLVAVDLRMQNAISKATSKIEYELKPESIVLVGSVAASRQTQKSDLDFLVIADSDQKITFQIENCNLVILSKDEFKNKYLKGDDFVVSSLSFGRVVFDEGLFMKFFENSLPIFSQEVIQEKLKYCETLEGRVYSLLKIGDIEKAREELVYLLLQAARIILLRNRIIPRTKLDIPGQVKPHNKELASILDSLLKKDKKMSKAGDLLRYAETSMKAVR